MNKRELGIFAGLAVVFLLAYFLNFSDPKIQNALLEAFYMLQWYARNHTLACVVPAMFADFRRAFTLLNSTRI